MTQHFPNGQQIKTRKAVLILMKHSAPPIVLYVDDPDELYNDLKNVIKTANAALPKIIERQAKGPVKNFCVLDSQLAGVALQEENYI